MSGLSANQEKSITALLNEASVAAAAAKVGVTERTLFRWLEDPAFREAYRQARRVAVSQAVARLQQASSEAVDALHQIVTDVRVLPSTRVSAASKILELAIKAVELEEIEARLSILEAALKEGRTCGLGHMTVDAPGK